MLLRQKKSRHSQLKSGLDTINIFPQTHINYIHLQQKPFTDYVFGPFGSLDDFSHLAVSGASFYLL